VFFAKNAVSALKLGQARGAAILTGKIHSLDIAEYSPTQVKQVIAGHGRADKEQVAKMLEIILGRQKFTTWDASDGLALAICHAQLWNSTSQAAGAASALQSFSRQRSKKKLSLAESVASRIPKKV
jgi:crossover junction endodeoxyribonuclease RuvC